MPPAPTASRILFRGRTARAASLLLLILLLVALTEGVGLLLLVPLLAAVSGAGAPAAGAAGRLIELLPFRPSLAPLLLAFVALVALRALLQLLRGVEGARVERMLVEGLRGRAAAALLRAEWRAVAPLRQGEGPATLISGIDRVGYGVHELIALAAALMLLGAAFLAALALSPTVALAALAGGGGVVLAYGVVRRRALRSGAELSEAYARLNGRLAETFAALRLIKSHGAEPRSAAALAEVDRRLTANRLGYQRLTGLAQALLQLAGAALLALLVWIAVARWAVSPLVLLPLIALFARVLPLLGAVQQHWHQWLNARPALEAVTGFIATMEAAAEPAAAGVALPRPQRAIALAGVTVRHAGRAGAALAAVDLELPVATTTALVGPSGAGKSTLADVLGGLIAPDAGALLLDGRALTPPERIAWRGHVAYVQQEPVLFDASIRDNLRWAAPEADDARLASALEQASAGFALALPAGLDTQVGEGGRRLSGGERQRIVLARALLREPALLILDEPTSALDPANEAAIAEAVARLRGRVTLLIVGHRGPLAEAADQVVRLEHGRVVARHGRVAAA